MSGIVRAPWVAGNLGNLGGRMLLCSCLERRVEIRRERERERDFLVQFEIKPF